ncbi:MAG: flagellar basal body-associated FliL family protein [Planctomycetes bacterium]|nr:flagellar basal body-associated FliL family protein [Planctomycetota bacterium]
MPADTRPAAAPGAGTGTGAAAPRGDGRLPFPPGMLLVVLLLMAIEAAVVALLTKSLVQHSAATGPALAGDTEYVDLGEIYATLPVDATGQTSRYFRVQVAVGLGKENRVEVRDRIERIRLRIQDEIQSILLKETYPQVRQPEAKKRVAGAILSALIGLLGPGTVQEVVLPKYEPQ